MNIAPGNNLQQKIGASSAGETVTFSPGTYSVSSPLNFLGGRTYQGNGAVLNWTAASNSLGIVNGNGATFRGLTFNGGGLSAVQNTSRLIVDSCAFQNIQSNSGTTDAGVLFNGLSDSSVIRCTFSKCQGDAAILGWNPLRCHFDDNMFVDSHEGFHAFWGTTAPQPCFSTLKRNVFNRIARYAVENQGCPDTWEVAFNWADNFTSADRATMVYSLPLTDSGSNAVRVYSKNVHVHHCYAGGIGLVPIGLFPWHENGNTGFNRSTAFEFGGDGSKIDHCLINGEFLVGILYTCTTPTWGYTNCTFAGCKPEAGGLVLAEFGGVAPLPANIFGNQILANMVAVPTPQQVTSGSYWNVDSGQVSPPAPPPPIVIPPIVIPPEVPVSIAATLNPDGSVTCVWTGSGPLTISGSDPHDTVTFAVQSPQTVTGLPPGWLVFFGDGASKTSVQTPGTPDPTIAFKPTLVAPLVLPATIDWTGMQAACDADDVSLTSHAASNAKLHAAIAAAKGQ